MSQKNSTIGRTWQRRTARSALAVISILATLTLVASPAAALPGGGGIIRNWQTGLCLDSNHNGDVYAMGCNGGNYQNWDEGWISRDHYQIVNKQTGRCLDANQAGQVYTSPCARDNPYQRWKPTNWNRSCCDYYRIQFQHHIHGNVCLDSDRQGKVYTMPCNGGNFQNWRADGNM